MKGLKRDLPCGLCDDRQRDAIHGLGRGDGRARLALGDFGRRAWTGAGRFWEEGLRGEARGGEEPVLTGLLLRAGRCGFHKSSHFRPVLRDGETESHRRPRGQKGAEPGVTSYNEPGFTPYSEAQTHLATRGGDEAGRAGQRPWGRRGGNVCIDYHGGKIR